MMDELPRRLIGSEIRSKIDGRAVHDVVRMLADHMRPEAEQLGQVLEATLYEDEDMVGMKCVPCGRPFRPA